MWKTDAIVVINQATPDRNAIHDIADALRLAGADVCDVDVEGGTIRICADHEKMQEIRFVDGIDYIRPVMHYQARGDDEDSDET